MLPSGDTINNNGPGNANVNTGEGRQYNNDGTGKQYNAENQNFTFYNYNFQRALDVDDLDAINPEPSDARLDNAAALADEPWPREPPEEEENLPDKPSLRPVAAIYYSAFNFRVYFQRGLTIYEGSCIGDEWKTVAVTEASDAKENTPLAAVRYNQGDEVRLYYITQSNLINELYWTAEKGWGVGSLTSKATVVSPYSSLSATCDASTINVFCQRGNMIYELSYSFFPAKWSYRKLAEGLRGTSIASTNYAGEKGTVYNVYFQDEGFYLQEYIYERQVVVDNVFPELELSPYTPLTAISWCIDYSYSRLYYTSDDGCIREICYDEDEDRKEPHDLPGSQEAKNSQIAALEQDDGGLIRIYHITSTGNLVQFSQTCEGDIKTTTVL